MNLNAMYLRRKAYLEAENSERVKRALKIPLRDINHGDMVFYKRPNIERWKRPAKIVGKEGKTLILRHGGLLIKAASCGIVKREYLLNSAKQTKDNDENVESNCSNNIEELDLDENEIDDVIMNQSVIAERRVSDSAAVDIEPQIEQYNQEKVSELTLSIVPGASVSKEEDELTTPKDLQKNHKISVNPTEIPKE